MNGSVEDENFLKVFFRNLGESGIQYCVLRNYEHLPHSLNGSDLDILVRLSDHASRR